MPSKRPPKDPLETNLNVRDAHTNQAGLQTKSRSGVYDKGEAPAENAYREEPNQEQG